MKVYELDNIKYNVGENAKDNWDIIDNAKQNYVWFHLDSFSSPHVIMEKSLIHIKKDKTLKSEKVYLLYGAELCKKYSKYKNYTNIKVMYTNIKNVKKGSKIGQVNIKGKRITINI